MRERILVVTVLPLRLFAGWVFLMEALSKLSTGWVQGGKLATLVGGWLQSGKSYGFYAPFLRTVVLPHASLFGWLVAGGELLVGAALLAGLFARWAALGGLVLTLNYLLARGDGAGANPTAPFVAICLTLLWAHPGRALGLDAALRGKVPDWLS
jgi:thiosulfate dehydrogenase [quinone] large subunit